MASSEIVSLDDLPPDHHHDGTVVVIDVIRAFTTAATAFAAGAREIRCVESLERAERCGARRPGRCSWARSEGSGQTASTSATHPFSSRAASSMTA